MVEGRPRRHVVHRLVCVSHHRAFDAFEIAEVQVAVDPFHRVRSVSHKLVIANGYRVPDLMRAIAVSATFYAVAAPSGKEGTISDRADAKQATGDKS